MVKEYLLEQQLQRVEEELINFKDEEFRDKYISDRKNLLSERIGDKPDRVPVKRGNITMKQHLQNLYKEINDEPEKVIQREISRLKARKERVEAEIGVLDGNIQN